MKNGRKGTCLKCDYLKVDVFGIDAWCTYKNMKRICTLDTKNNKLEPTISQSDERQDKLIKKLECKVNPYWCPLKEK